MGSVRSWLALGLLGTLGRGRHGRAATFGPEDRLAVIAIPKTGTRSIEIFLQKHTPLRIPQSSPGGSLYALPSSALAGPDWPPSSAALQPLPARPGEQRANPDLFLFHANFEEVAHDWKRHLAALRASASAPEKSANSPRLLMTTMLRDPVDRFVSEFRFGLEFKMQGAWGTPDAWRRQFWGQRDLSDEQLLHLRDGPPADFQGSRLEWLVEMPWLPAHNRQTRFLAGESNVSVAVTRSMLQRAKRNLRLVDVIGFTGETSDYFASLSCALPPGLRPWRRGDTVQDNVSEGSTDANSPRVRRAVMKFSWADVELIAYARRLVRARPPECSP